MFQLKLNAPPQLFGYVNLHCKSSDSLDNIIFGTFEWPSQTTEDVCAVSTIFIQIKLNFQDYLNTI